jgi:hypothetical protein
MSAEDLATQRWRKLSRLDAEIDALQRRLDREREVHRQMQKHGFPLSHVELGIKDIAEELALLVASRLALMEEMATDPAGTKFS